MPDKIAPKDRKFATLSWRIGDIMDITQFTEEEAIEWMENNSKALTDRLAECGNETLENLLSDDGHLNDDDDDSPYDIHIHI